MSLYTGKGDKGDTGTFGCDQRISKSSTIAEALGALDETNSVLGVCRTQTATEGFSVAKRKFNDILESAQQHLFVAQAEVAGADKTISQDSVQEIEHIIDTIEKELPPIKTFFVPGGVELAAFLDMARTIARRAERRVIAAHEEGQVTMKEHTLAYLNRLSSLLYALARLTNHKSGITEEPPHY